MYKKMLNNSLELNKHIMLQRHLIDRGIHDKNILTVFENVPREKFLPINLRKYAYSDTPLPIGFNQTISQPYVVALMCQLLELKDTDKVLDIGTGSGYQAAILAQLSKSVISIERIEYLAKRSRNTIKELGYKNIKIIVGDGSKGYKQNAPYNKIICAASIDEVPKEWKDQLTDKGIIVFPKIKNNRQELTVMYKNKDKYITKNYGNVIFVPLIRD